MWPGVVMAISRMLPRQHFPAIGDHPADLGGGERLVHAGLRIVGARHAGVEHLFRRRGCDQRRAGQLLQPRDPADMVEMLMADQQIFDVAKAEAELADIVGDQFRARFGPASISTWPSSPVIRIAEMPQVPTR